MLELFDVRVAYGETMAVDGFSLTITDHETVALLGPSGSGKTTTRRSRWPTGPAFYSSPVKRQSPRTANRQRQTSQARSTPRCATSPQG